MAATKSSPLIPCFEMEISFSFFIRVDEDGSQRPQISVFPPKFSILSHLANGELSTSEGVRNELRNLKKAIQNSDEKYSFAGNDMCIAEVNGGKCTLHNGFGEFKPVEIATEEIVNLLQEWIKFLEKFEKGEIPGIK